METTYEFILRLKHTQCWEGCKCLFPQASTLERYFRVYELSLQLEPDKNRGYLKRLLENPDVVHLLGAPDVAHLKIALHKMRRLVRAITFFPDKKDNKLLSFLCCIFRTFAPDFQIAFGKSRYKISRGEIERSPHGQGKENDKRLSDC